MKIYLLFNLETSCWSNIDYMRQKEVSDLFEADERYRTREDAQQIADYLNLSELEYSQKDDSIRLKYIPPGWDFDEDGDLKGNQLSGPWVVKCFELTECAD